MSEAVERFTVQSYLTPDRRRPLRRIGQLVRMAVRIVWEAAPRQLVRCGVLQLLIAVSVAFQLLVLRSLLQDLLGTSVTLSDTAPELAALAGIGLVAAAAAAVLDFQQRILGQLVARSTSDEMIRAAGTAELIHYELPGFHDRLQRAQLSAATRPAQMTNGLLGLMGASISIAAIATALLIIEPLFCLLAVGAFLPALAASNRAGRLVYRYSVEQTELERRRVYLFGILLEKPTAQEMRAFGLPGFLADRHRELFDELLDRLRSVLRQRLRVALAGQTTSVVVGAGALALLVWFVTDDRMSLADAGTAAGAMVLLTTRLRSMAGGAGGLYEGALYLEDYISFVHAAEAETTATGGRPPAPADVEVVSAHDVTFTYPTRSEPSLVGASLELRRGEVVALVGENGSGKTTFAKLLAGLYEPQAGRITFDGTDLTGCDPATVRDRVAVIFQDFVRYQLSAYDNVALGHHPRFAEAEAVEQAAREAGIHDVLASLPRGYDSLLGPEYYGGTNISGGQWQRIALARALFRPAPIVILDEPTAALDPRAEAALFESTRRLFSDRAVLLISHRFGSVRTADRIYVLHEGRVVEEGRHADLVAAGGHYAELFRLQASRYVD